eukprot:7672831-Lingulodinium_polyedra.AAC.1
MGRARWTAPVASLAQSSNNCASQGSAARGRNIGLTGRAPASWALRRAGPRAPPRGMGKGKLGLPR